MPLGLMPYGPAKAGKSRLGASSWWDFKEKVVRRKGLHIVVGLESLEHLGVPRAEKFGDVGYVRLAINVDKPTSIFDTSRKLLRDIYRAAKAGSGYDVIVLDGISEFDLQEQRYMREGEGELDMKQYMTLLAGFFDSLQYVHPEETGAHLIVTARGKERRQAIKGAAGKTLVEEDKNPQIADFDYYPAITGAFGHNVPHYFQIVGYMETV